MVTFAEEVPYVEDGTVPTIPSPQPALEIPNRWITSPALRGWAYGVSFAVVALLITIGVLTSDVADNILLLIGAVLGLPGLALARANRPKLTSGDVPDVSVAVAAENVDHAIVIGDVKPLD